MKTVKPRPSVIVIIGLPGSGKTTLLNKWKNEGKIADFCDDYQNNPEKKSRDPKQSPHFRHLIKGLSKGQTWALSDIRYCDKKERAILVKALKETVPGLKLGYVFFENRPDICENNVIIRNRGLAPHRKNLIYYYTDIYEIPKGVEVLPVYRA